MTHVALVRIVFLSNILSFNVARFRDIANNRLVHTSWKEAIEFYGKFEMWNYLANSNKILQLFVKDSNLWLIRNCVERGRCDFTKKRTRRGEEENSPLHMAAQNGAMLLIKYLVRDLNFNTEIKDVFEWTPLITACYYDTPESINILLECGANIEASNRQNATGLLTASLNGNEHSIRALFSGKVLPNIHASTVQGWSPLYVAAEHGHLGCLRALLDLGCDPNFSISQVYALHAACTYGRHEFVDTLLKAGANCNVVTSEGNTPLMYAAKRGCTICIQLLLDAGASKKMMNRIGETALSQVCISDCRWHAIIQMLKY